MERQQPAYFQTATYENEDSILSRFTQTLKKLSQFFMAQLF